MDTQIDYKTALRCATLSTEVYKSFQGKRLRFSILPSLEPHFFEDHDTDTQGAVLENPGSQRGYIIFRGSDADRDWLTNLDFSQRSGIAKAIVGDKKLTYPDIYDPSTSGVKMHAGFIKAYLSVRDDIHRIVANSDLSNWIVTGHSLGGALSKLCALDVQYNFRDKLSVETYTFGAPRVGNKAFVDSYNRRVPGTYRFVNGNDFVSGLPRRWQGYRHVDYRIKFNPRFNWRFISGSLQDHRIDKYISELTQRAAQEN